MTRFASKRPLVAWSATKKQIEFIRSLADELGMDDDDLEEEVDEEFGCDVASLTRTGASLLIDDLLERKRTMRR